jgi:type I restriction enzyme M protein
MQAHGQRKAVIMQSTTGADAYVAHIADLFRTSMYATEAREFVLPLLFLRAISSICLDGNRAGRRLRQLITIPPESDFTYLLEKKGSRDIGSLINRALKELALANPWQLAGVFDGVDFNSNKLGQSHGRNSLLSALIQRLDQPFSEPDSGDRSLGNKYTRVFALSVDWFNAMGKHGGEGTTIPLFVRELIAQLVAAKEVDTIYDPLCGTGDLLISCITLSPFDNTATNTLSGHERKGSAWAQAKMNLLLNGQDSTNIRLGEWSDFLHEAPAKPVSIIVANTPWFSRKPFDYAAGSEKKTIFGDLPLNYSRDYDFILEMLAKLDPIDGRMAVIIPNGPLFWGGGDGEVRRVLIEMNLVFAVIALPAKVFSQINVPFNILLLKRNKRDRNIIFVDASNAHEAGKGRHTLSKKTVDAIVETCAGGIAPERCTRHVASIEEAGLNDFVLSVGRYGTAGEAPQSIDVTELESRRLRLESEVAELDTRIALIMTRYED